MTPMPETPLTPDLPDDPMDASMDATFKALASRARRRILDILRSRPGSNVNEVSAHFEMSRIAVMKHLAVLEEADLVVSKKEGRTRKLYFNAIPIQQIYDRWTTEYSRYWSARLTALKFRVESQIDPTTPKNPIQGDDG